MLQKAAKERGVKRIRATIFCLVLPIVGITRHIEITTWRGSDEKTD